MKEEYEEIQKELLKEYPILDLVSFNEINIQDKLKNNAYLIAQYSTLLISEKREYERLEEMYDSLVGMRYDHYRFNMDKELTKIEIEKYYLPKDEKIKQMKSILNRQMTRVEFFDMCVKGLKQAGYNMSVFSQNERRGI